MCPTAVPLLANVDSNNLLTLRERQILEELIQGFSSQEIATHLYISRKTVDFHLMNIYRKLQVSSKMQAVRKAFQLGLLSMEEAK